MRSLSEAHRQRGDQPGPSDRHAPEESIYYADSPRALVHGICATTPDRRHIYRYSGSGTYWWEILRGGTIPYEYTLYGGLYGLVVGQSGGNLWLYDGDRPGDPLLKWIRIYDTLSVYRPVPKLTDVAMTHSSLYVNFTDGVYRFTEQTSWMWQKVGRPAGRIYAGGYGLVATDPNTGALFIYQGSPGYWTQIGGAGAEFAVTDDSIYGLTPNKGAVYRYDRYPGTSWTWVGGPASRLYGGDWGLVATDPDGNLWRYTYIPYEHPGNWQLIGGPGAEFAVADRTVFGLTPDKGAVYRYDGYGTSWTYVGGAAAQIATAGNV